MNEYKLLAYDLPFKVLFKLVLLKKGIHNFPLYKTEKGVSYRKTYLVDGHIQTC